MHMDVEIATEALQAGASGYVFKRNASTDLIRVLNETLSGRTTFPELDDEATPAR